MALALRVLFLLCGISGLLTGAWSLSHHGYGGCCPRGWNQLNDHCYSLKHEAKTFADAASVCQTLGGNLVSIHSYLENLVTVGLLEKGDAKFAWIGLHDPAEDGHFQWLDGTHFDFDHFGHGEPSNDGACAVMYAGGEWFVKDCTFKAPYVCIRDAYCCGSH